MNTKGRPRSVRAMAAVGLVGAALACGGSDSRTLTAPLVPSPTAPPIHLSGIANDFTGDARSLYGSVAPEPDLVAAKVEVVGSDVTITVGYAAGTFNRANNETIISLDVDHNPATGYPGLTFGGDRPTDADQMGVEYVVSFPHPMGSDVAVLSSLNGAFLAQKSAEVGRFAATFPAADQVQVTFPLNLLGGSNGRLSFKIVSAQWIEYTAERINGTAALDFMPDVGQPPGLVQ